MERVPKIRCSNRKDVYPIQIYDINLRGVTLTLTNNGHLQGYLLAFYRLPISFSILFLKVLVEGADTMNSDNEFHISTTLWLKNCLLHNLLHCDLLNFKL